MGLARWRNEYAGESSTGGKERSGDGKGLGMGKVPGKIWEKEKV